jgi:hypothetical protein
MTVTNALCNTFLKNKRHEGATLRKLRLKPISNALDKVAETLKRGVAVNDGSPADLLSTGSTCRRIRYRMFSQPGGL